MKIAIVTVYDSIINYGSYLQAFALNQVLKELGHEVYFVRRMSDEEILKRFNSLCVEQNRVPTNKKLRVLRQLRRNRFVKIEQKANQSRYKVFQKDWKEFRFINPKEIDKIGIDLLICGSDEIWNLHNKDVDFNFYSCAWAKNIPKLAYAISSGNTKLEELVSIKNSLEAIADFNIVLPRDEETQNLIKEVTEVSQPQVCDPTILWGYNNYTISDKGREYGKYLLIYSYYFTSREKEYILKYAKEHELKIISPCIYTDFADENVYISSLHFPSLIKNAECVFSTTFHGTIFSLMFAKRFCCSPRLSKVTNLLERCEAMDYALMAGDSYEQFIKILNQDMNHTKIYAIMDEMKFFSQKMLKNSIEKIKENGRKPVGTKYYDADKYYYGYSLNCEKVRKQSSSGGVFYELAQNVLLKGGVVFGAAYDEATHTVRHCSTNETSLELLMKSKYVESKLEDTFIKIKKELESGKIVLFCGTPCQAAGLRNYTSLCLQPYLNKIYIIDFLCEGVPSNKVFLEYQRCLEKKYRSKVKDVVFRSKSYGWNIHCMKVLFENGKEYIRPSFADPYMHTFLMDLAMNRRSCYQCEFRTKKMSDITIADFWKADSVDANCQDNKGVSAVFVHTEKGEKMLSAISNKLYLKEVAPEKQLLMKQNLNTAPFYKRRNEFYKVFCKEGFENAVDQFSSYLKKNYGIKKMKRLKAWGIWELKRKFGKF